MGWRSRGFFFLILITSAMVAGCRRAQEPARPLVAGLARSGVENRIVLVGDGLIEQSRLYGYVETVLVESVGKEDAVIVRNLGWSGDSVFGEARTGGYEKPEGVDRLMKEVKELRPTAIFVGYGMMASFEGESGVERFAKGYEALVEKMVAVTPTVVLLSPGVHEGNEAQNRELERYSGVIAKIAQERKLAYVDLHGGLMEYKRAHPDARLTSNEITLNELGYRVAAETIADALGQERVEFGTENVEKLRGALVKSGELFYRRERPANDHSRHWTYIDKDFGMYDRELAELDKEIARLRREAMK